MRRLLKPVINFATLLLLVGATGTAISSGQSQASAPTSPCSVEQRGLMNFQRVTDLFAPDGHAIPAFLFSPDSPRGGALVCPGYGGTKEHVLALAAAIAEKGLAALAIDPCGHGENMAAIAPGIPDELEARGWYLRRFCFLAAFRLRPCAPPS